jgi:hypothetical protein
MLRVRRSSGQAFELPGQLYHVVPGNCDWLPVNFAKMAVLILPNRTIMPVALEDPKAFCVALPKIELHAHINGSISFETIKKLTDRKVSCQ